MMAPDLKWIASSFGGGWLIPISPEARQTFGNQFDEDAYPIPPLDGQEGWIIEPNEERDLMADIRADGWQLIKL